MKTRRWQIALAEEQNCREIARTADVSYLLARCLCLRGCNPESASIYLEPKLAKLSDPFLLPNMERAVDRLFQAHAAGDALAIFGDYDVDGVTSTAVLADVFQKLGWRSSYYLPHRIDEGYGLSLYGVQNCLRKFPVKLLLAVDCGSSSREVIAELASAGVEVIVLDHHQVCDPPPEALALVNPRVAGTGAECADLCSAGLAFKLAHAVLKRARTLDWPEAHAYDIREALDLVALGTIADLVPLRGENRILARCGLERLGTTKRAGLQALKRVSGVTSPVSAQQVAFQLAPRLNAAGRLETALDALELLLTTDSARAERLATALDEQNRVRQEIEEKIAQEALAAVRTRFNPDADFAIVEGSASWHLGVVGIVASRVLREFHRPVVILGSDGSGEWRGSGRSIEGLDLAAALRDCGDLLLKHGGHAMAAGVTMSSERVAEFRERFNACVRSKLTAEALQPMLRLDAEVNLNELTFHSVKALESLEPTGQGNPPVQLAARGLRLRGEPRRLGVRAQHLRFNVTDGASTQAVVWWNAPAGQEESLAAPFDLAFAPELNEFNGTFGVQLRLIDLQPSA
jgi:single-stranded-DNA-specific exonuclease